MWIDYILIDKSDSQDTIEKESIMNKRTRRSFTYEFKEQIVKLYQSSKKVIELSREYELSEQQIYRLMREYEGSRSCKATDNRSDRKISI